MAFLMLPRAVLTHLKAGVSSPATAPGDDWLMRAAGLPNTAETAQAVTEDDAGGIEIALCHIDDVGSAEALHPAQFEADRFAFGRGLDRGHDRRLARRTAAPLPPWRSPPR